MRQLPGTALGLIEMLEEQYPPKCLGPHEELHDHLRYAGKVDLIAKLRAHWTAETKAEKGELERVLQE